MLEVRTENYKGETSIVTPLTIRSDVQYITAETFANLKPIEQFLLTLFSSLAGQTLPMRMFDLSSIWLQINGSRLKDPIKDSIHRWSCIDGHGVLENSDFIRAVRNADSNDYEVRISVLYVKEPVSDLQERLKSTSFPL